MYPSAVTNIVTGVRSRLLPSALYVRMSRIEKWRRRLEPINDTPSVASAVHCRRDPRPAAHSRDYSKAHLHLLRSGAIRASISPLGRNPALISNRNL